jgi:hypothetical protein
VPEVLLTVFTACLQAGADIQVRLLLSIDRRQSTDEALETARLAVQLRDKGVVGLDLSGNPSVGQVGEGIDHRCASCLPKRERRSQSPVLEACLKVARCSHCLTPARCRVLFSQRSGKLGCQR